LNPSTFGQAVTFTVQVTPNQGGVRPTGTVTFKDGATTLGTSTSLANVAGIATATFTTGMTQLTGGTHPITAIYDSDPSFSPSTSPNFTQHLKLALSLSTMPYPCLNPSIFGQAVTFTAPVTPNQGSVLPSGQLTFKDGATTLGTSTSLASVGGVAT